MGWLDSEYLRRESWTLREAASLLAGINPATSEQRRLHTPAWRLRDNNRENLADATDAGAIAFVESVTRSKSDRRLRPWDVVQWAIARGDDIPPELRRIAKPAAPTPAGKMPMSVEAHVSDKLAKLNQAARKFWSPDTVNREDRDTHPTNEVVAAWLRKNGFTPTLAEKGASIIRPDWAPTGRKPEK